MKGLPDAGITRHAEHAGLEWLFSAVQAGGFGWSLEIPGAVARELAAGGKSPRLASALEGISVVSCIPAQLSETASRLSPTVLGPGELDAISIAVHLGGGEPEDCVILTDDVGAQKAAGTLGIGSLDILEFLQMANEWGLLTRDGAVRALELLQRDKVYESGGQAWGNFLSRLR